MAKQIAFYSGKGGTGKTTLALQVCANLSRRINPETGLTFNVMFIDLDPQASVVTLDKMGQGEKLGFPVKTKMPLPGIMQKLDFVVVDYPPTVTPLPKSEDVVVMPARPSLLDQQSVKTAKAMLLHHRAHNAPVIINVVNQYVGSRTEHTAFVNSLRGKNPHLPVITSRSIYERVTNRADTIYGAGLMDVMYGSREAKKEIEHLTETILANLK